MTDLTPETIAHLRELNAARTQGEAAVVGGGEYLLPFGIMVDPDEGGITDADADFIAMAANHMSALLDAVEERDEYRERFRNQMNAATDTLAEVSRLRAELADAAVRVKGAESAARILYAALTETRAQIERVTALAAKWDEDRALYPTNSDSRAVPAAVAVRLCTEELRAALTPAEPRCGTCRDTGTVEWMVEADPNCYQEPDSEGRIPCPDCASARPEVEKCIRCGLTKRAAVAGVLCEPPHGSSHDFSATEPASARPLTLDEHLADEAAAERRGAVNALRTIATQIGIEIPAMRADHVLPYDRLATWLRERADRIEAGDA